MGSLKQRCGDQTVTLPTSTWQTILEALEVTAQEWELTDKEVALDAARCALMDALGIVPKATEIPR